MAFHFREHICSSNFRVDGGSDSFSFVYFIFETFDHFNQNNNDKTDSMINLKYLKDHFVGFTYSYFFLAIFYSIKKLALSLMCNLFVFVNDKKVPDLFYPSSPLHWTKDLRVNINLYSQSHFLSNNLKKHNIIYSSPCLLVSGNNKPRETPLNYLILFVFCFLNANVIIFTLFSCP